MMYTKIRELVDQLNLFPGASILMEEESKRSSNGEAREYSGGGDGSGIIGDGGEGGWASALSLWW